MTLNEYAEEVGNALRNAHNNKDMAALNAKFKEADEVLDHNNISQTHRKEFWENVRKATYSGSWRLEEQANSALVALMRAIEQSLATRGSTRE